MAPQVVSPCRVILVQTCRALTNKTKTSTLGLQVLVLDPSTAQFGGSRVVGISPGAVPDRGHLEEPCLGRELNSHLYIFRIAL